MFLLNSSVAPYWRYFDSLPSLSLHHHRVPHPVGWEGLRYQETDQACSFLHHSLYLQMYHNLLLCGLLEGILKHAMIDSSFILILKRPVMFQQPPLVVIAALCLTNMWITRKTLKNDCNDRIYPHLTFCWVVGGDHNIL